MVINYQPQPDQSRPKRYGAVDSTLRSQYQGTSQYKEYHKPLNRNTTFNLTIPNVTFKDLERWIQIMEAEGKEVEVSGGAN